MESVKWSYGRLSAGIEANVARIPGHPTTTAQVDMSDSERSNASSSGSSGDLYHDAVTSHECYDLSDQEDASSTASTSNSVLLSLPAELLDYICRFLPPVDLSSISLTCRALRTHSSNDLHWQRHVQDNVPGVRLTTSAPCRTYRELYFSHDPYWFVPRYKIWFCDLPYTGKLVLARYDPRRGCIEGYRLVAERAPPEFESWEHDDEVVIHSFKPRVRLHLDIPVLQLDASSPDTLVVLPRNVEDASERFHRETPMRVPRAGTFSGIFLTRTMPTQAVHDGGSSLWPPSTIPHNNRVRCQSQNSFHGSGHKPQSRREVNEQSFRIRKWIRMNQQVGEDILGRPGTLHHHVEDVQTFSTLDPELYTPTPEYPWRGIWVGDYSGHGCEFLLMHQPTIHPFNERSVRRREDETSEQFLARRKEEKIHRGSIEAIKLTGDPNVPRGEHTFIADDIGPDGFIRTAEEKRFEGARIVRSRGHIAERFFRCDKYVESQLIMISPDRLAQYWVGFGHISYYERVNIDEFLSPFDDRRN